VRRLGTSIFILGVATLAGCGGAGTMPPPGNVTLALGSAMLDGSGFVPLAGEQTLVAGAQGGFHVWITYRVHGMAPATLTVHRTARRKSDGALVLTTDGTIDVGAAGPDGWWQLDHALPNFICPTPIGVNVIDQALEFDVEMQDDAGATVASGHAEATVHCPDGSENALCHQICAG
jgi:hypothetical protein